MSGLQLLQRLRDLHASVPIIVITSDADPTIRSRVQEGGAHAYLLKPIESRVLLTHLESALAGRGKRSPNG